MPYRYPQNAQRKARTVEWLARLLLFPWLRSRPVVESSNELRILFVEPFQMGDVLSVTPMFEPLFDRFPNVRIYFLAKPSSAAILRMDSRITEVFEFDFVWSDYGNKRTITPGYMIRLIRFMHALRSYQFDVGIDTRGDIRSQLLMVLTGCYARLGYLRYLASNLTLRGYLLTRHLAGDQVRHRYDWNLMLLTLLGVSPDLPIRFPAFRPSGVQPRGQSSDYLLIHVGGGWEYKRWNMEKWTSLINDLGEAQPRRIMIVGSAAESQILNTLEQANRNLGTVTFRITSLTELVELVISCKLFVGLDSGPMNLAVCLGRPVVALFGPGDSTMWYPYGSRGSMIHHVEKFPCNPCHQTVCQFPEHHCMREISATEVLGLILLTLKKLT